MVPRDIGVLVDGRETCWHEFFSIAPFKVLAGAYLVVR